MLNLKSIGKFALVPVSLLGKQQQYASARKR
jgi:hypothetical protein